MVIERPVDGEAPSNPTPPRIADVPEPVLPFEPYEFPIGPSLEPPGGTSTVSARRYKNSPRPARMESADYASLPKHVRDYLGAD